MRYGAFTEKEADRYQNRRDQRDIERIVEDYISETSFKEFVSLIELVADEADISRFFDKLQFEPRTFEQRLVGLRFESISQKIFYHTLVDAHRTGMVRECIRDAGTKNALAKLLKKSSFLLYSEEDRVRDEASHFALRNLALTTFNDVDKMKFALMEAFLAQFRLHASELGRKSIEILLEREGLAPEAHFGDQLGDDAPGHQASKKVVSYLLFLRPLLSFYR